MAERGILITGATGNVGREVVAAALRRGLRATAALRDLVDARGVPEGVPLARLDYLDRSTWSPALEGHDALFLVRPPAISDVRATLNPFIDAAYRSGVRHIVFLSVAGADRNRIVPHAKVEAHLAASGRAFTNLRPGFFAQNLQDAYRRDILEEDRIILPSGRAPVNWIDVRDVAEVAALIFADPAQHQGRSYLLTGPGAVGWERVVGLLSEVTGRQIRYEPVSILRYVLHLKRRGLPAGAILVRTILHTLLRFGQGATYDSTLERLLGRPPRSIAEYIRDHADVWRH